MADIPHFNGAASAAPSGLSAIGDHMPFLIALAALPSMKRWQLARLVNRAIECVDLLDGDPDLEEDDPAEEHDWGGGAVDDEGEPEEPDGIGHHGLDQRDITHWGEIWRDA